MKKWIVAGALPIVAGHLCYADDLGLEKFLDQVRKGNEAYTSLRHSSDGAFDRSEEGNLVTSPTLFANGGLSRDSKLPQLPFFSYDSLIANTFAVGVSQQTTFGLQAKLSYNVAYTSFVNPNFPGSVGDLSFHDAAPAVELTQSLWANGFGAGTRASEEQASAGALSEHFGNRYQARVSLAQAEIAYWRLSTSRQAVRVAEAALERAVDIEHLSARRARLQLADHADELQAQAALESRRLDAQVSRDEEANASRAFNSARGIDSSDVSERLDEPNVDDELKLQAPKRDGTRDDVKAAEQQQRQTRAGAEASLQHDLPTLEVYGAWAMNGRAGPLASTLNDSVSSGRPTEAIGLRFQVPLDVGVLSKSRDGWRKEQLAAEELYQRKLFEQESDWKDLETRFSQARRNLQLARSAERSQIEKLKYEKLRLDRGRSTTYQVLLFEQDFLTAQLARIRSQSDLLGVLAQMKLYGEQL